MALLGWAALLFADTQKSNTHAGHPSVPPERIIQYIRERFQMPATVKMAVGPFRDSVDPYFRQATVAVDDGKQKKDQNILVSKDERYLVVGDAFALNGNQLPDISRFVRQQFKIPDTMQVTATPPRKSAFPNFDETTVSVTDGKNKRSQNFFLSKEGHTIILGNIFNFNADPKRDILRTIVMKDQPSEGPANAPVTLVEYADLECPTCARMHEFLNSSLVPKYGNKMRIIFKEFPLPMHDWAMTAAIASQCAYQNNPEAFAAYRSLVFKNQSLINVTNVRDMLLSLAAQVGIDSLKLSTCLDTKASLSRVEENLREGQQLGVVSTPTSYINGKMVVGVATPETYYNAIDEALKTSR